MWRALALAILLTALAGYVDAAGYLSFAKIYTANMSGNSVAVGIGLGQRDWWQFFERLWPVILYVLGLFCGRTLIEIGGRCRIRRIATPGFLLELVLIGCAIAFASSQVTGIAMLAFAMGLQNALLTHFSSLTVHTGFVTGTLVRMVEEAVRYLTWLWDASKKLGSLRIALAGSGRQRCFRNTVALSVIWLAYVAGAAICATILLRLGIYSLLFVVPPLLGLVALDWRHPLAIQEEEAQLHGK